MAVVMVVMAQLIGPKRRGPIKHATYESGMELLGDTQRRFNVRFYIVAVLFLLFDIEVVFLWPWAVLYRASAMADEPIADLGGMAVGKDFLLVGGGLFLLILLVGFVYEWRKGAFRWD
jgi:NADH-quinone oxidoreductase subunit A